MLGQIFATRVMASFLIITTNSIQVMSLGCTTSIYKLEHPLHRYRSVSKLSQPGINIHLRFWRGGKYQTELGGLVLWAKYWIWMEPLVPLEKIQHAVLLLPHLGHWPTNLEVVHFSPFQTTANHALSLNILYKFCMPISKTYWHLWGLWNCLTAFVKFPKTG